MKPNLFLVGAPKCGTSSLFDWLCQHPDIRGTTVKEPFFLIDPTHPLARRPNLAMDGWAAYGSLFRPEDLDAPIRMEGTTHYLFDSFAREKIAALAGAKVIIVLREPAARVFSSFNYTKNNLARLRSGITFAKYLSLIETGTDLTPEWCNHRGSAYVLERDVQYSLYHEYVGQWFSQLGRDSVRIVLMENMVRAPLQTVLELISWLNLDSSKLPNLDVRQRNKTHNVRSPAVQAAARSMMQRIRLPESMRSRLKQGYAAFQYRKSLEATQEDFSALEALRKRYEPHNLQLSQMTGLNLAIWTISS